MFECLSHPPLKKNKNIMLCRKDFTLANVRFSNDVFYLVQLFGTLERQNQPNLIHQEMKCTQEKLSVLFICYGLHYPCTCSFHIILLWIVNGPFRKAYDENSRCHNFQNMEGLWSYWCGSEDVAVICCFSWKLKNRGLLDHSEFVSGKY